MRPTRDPKAVETDIENEFLLRRRLEHEIEDKERAIEKIDKRLLQLMEELARLKDGWNGL